MAVVSEYWPVFVIPLMTCETGLSVDAVALVSVTVPFDVKSDVHVLKGPAPTLPAVLEKSVAGATHAPEAA